MNTGVIDIDIDCKTTHLQDVARLFPSLQVVPLKVADENIEGGVVDATAYFMVISLDASGT